MPTATILTGGQVRALASVSDADLDCWIEACEAMDARPALASSARQQWKWLLAQALAQREQRQSSAPALASSDG